MVGMITTGLNTNSATLLPLTSQPWQWQRGRWWCWAVPWSPSFFPLCSSSSAPTVSTDGSESILKRPVSWERFFPQYLAYWGRFSVSILNYPAINLLPLITFFSPHFPPIANLWIYLNGRYVLYDLHLFYIRATNSVTLRDSFLVSLPPEADTSLSEPLYNFVSDC